MYSLELLPGMTLNDPRTVVPEFDMGARFYDTRSTSPQELRRDMMDAYNRIIRSKAVMP